MENDITKSYSERLEINSHKLKEYKSKGNINAWARGITFVAGSVATVWLLYIDNFASLISFLVFGFVFTILIKKSTVINELIIYHSELVNININELKALKWEFDFFDNGKEYLDTEKSFLYDLDVFGDGSIFQYLNRTSTKSGKDLLAGYFINPELIKEEIEIKQLSVAELAPLLDWRQEFQAKGIIADEKPDQKERLFKWLNEDPWFSKITGISVLLILMPALSFTFLFLLIFGIISEGLFIVYLLIPLSIAGGFLQRVNKEQRVLTNNLELAKKYSSLLQLIENGDFKSKRLGVHQYNLTKDGYKASRKVSDLVKILHSLDNRNNMIVGVLLNALFLWDLQYMVKIEKWRTKHKDEFNIWIDILSEFDALSSLANLGYNFPDYVYADISSGDFMLSAIDAGHILIPSNSRVTNTFEISGKSVFTIITGANMAGKSTFLRTIGVTMLLGMAGAPVCAKRFQFKPVEVFSSMRTTDSLIKNESYFYAELSRLKQLIDNLRDGKEYFIILDEVLKGTNSRDKSEGSKALVKQLINMETYGIIATHDVSLGNIIQEFPDNILNHCFEVEISNNQLIFDYKLREGISKNLNATFLMKNMGITI